jgi:hypothetical protein
VLRHDDVWLAKRELSVRFSRGSSRAVAWWSDVTTRGIKTDVATRVTPVVSKVNPVRQCARRGVVGRGVAQASPLFSDHAPREVHLWQ